jgi:FAD synthase
LTYFHHPNASALMLCQVSKVQRQLYCLENILLVAACRVSSLKTLREEVDNRKMSSNLGGDYVDAKVLENPFKVEGEVVKGFGRGSRELNIPTGRCSIDSSPNLSIFPRLFVTLANVRILDTRIRKNGVFRHNLQA